MSPADPRWIVLAILTVLVSNQISLTCAIASSEMTVLSWIAGYVDLHESGTKPTGSVSFGVSEPAPKR